MSFNEIKGMLGFGCMRMKMDGEEVDYKEFSGMIDMYIAAGFNYFDTAHGYIDGKSETALKACLTSRYKREDYILANKLSEWFFEKEEDIVPLFEKQLEKCGVDYFDFYLFHAVNRKSYEKLKSVNAFSVVEQLKREGKIRHIAMSFHDSADVLDKILSEQPSIEAVQLQINYLDYDDPGVQSKACYDVAEKHCKKVIVMEPVKGGRLANLPDEAKEVFDNLGGGSYASYALRYAASYPNVFMVLSGMGTTEMMQDNINTFTDFKPLDEKERAATDKAREIIRRVNMISCTKCNYCADVCPMNIPISDIFEVYNTVLAAKKTVGEAREMLPASGGAMSECIKCGKCEEVCPQSIQIREHIEKISKRMEK